MSADYSILKANWPDQADKLKKIRESVFVIEQSVSSEIEWDGRDHLCQHVIAYSNTEQPIGTGRILPSGHIGRIAVNVAWRGKGVGSAILKALIKLATDSVYLNSQTHAIPFYQKFDFVPEGKVFMEAGIPHQKMTLKLKAK
ncbi:MAG: GNAT family N-acetyltransferase [Gammaproteobacteria bacterium]|nr:GNAT family N-acetyltransferase [Gammaproteobacteria bacterium]